MKRIRLNESELKRIVSESVKRVINEMQEDKEIYNELFDDAVEAIEMSDGMIDFYEWFPAFQDGIDEDFAEQVFNDAWEHCKANGII